MVRYRKWFKYVRLGILVGLSICTLVPAGRFATLHADAAPINVWWPVQGAQVDGVQPFKAVLNGLDPSAYRMTWNVDNGDENPMPNSWRDVPHKEAMVDLSTWNWSSENTYTLVFRAYNQTGQLIGEQSSDIHVPSKSNVAASGTTTPTASPQRAQAGAGSENVPVSPVPPKPLPSLFYTSPDNPAFSTAASWRSTRPQDAVTMAKIGAVPTAQWIGGWNLNVTAEVDQLTAAAAAAGKTPVLVAYNIPNRDCGSFSAGGASPDSYGAWIRAIAGGIKGRPAEVILEPDALAQIGCLTPGDQAARLAMLAGAVRTLKSSPATKVYLDAGHPGWGDTQVMASRLESAGIGIADGFALNVSNYISTQRNSTYGRELSSLTRGKHFVVDTSRNGSGGAADGQWCNTPGQALGVSPTTATGDPLIDAFLWIKKPGESDGACNGGPSAGTWWPEYALQLARSTGF